MFVYYKKTILDHICITCFCIILFTEVYMVAYKSTPIHILNGETLRVLLINF